MYLAIVDTILFRPKVEFMLKCMNKNCNFNNLLLFWLNVV